MIDAFDLINLVFAVAGLMLSLLGLLLSCFIRINDRRSRSFFIMLFLFITFYVASDLAGNISLTFLGEGYAWLSKLAIFSESLFSSLLMPLLTRFILHLSGKDHNRNPLFLLNILLWILYFTLLVITQFTTSIYYLTDNNVYRRGPIYPILLLPPILMMILNLIMLVKYRGDLSKRQVTGFLFYLLLPLAAMIFQVFFYGLYIIMFATTISGLLLFVQILQTQMDIIARQAEDNTRAQIDMMLMQIRPHFIYNTLSSAYYLCETNPRKAQQTIGDFTAYLRKNLSAVGKHELIPFSEELAHTRAYLNVEKARYESILSVHYETDYIAFMIPALTLEPLVENAVKHGIDPEVSSLHITVRTLKLPQASAVVVEDDGPGFDPQEDNETHIGINNVKERLRLMCGGTLSITNREEGGTIAMIRIPL